VEVCIFICLEIVVVNEPRHMNGQGFFAGGSFFMSVVTTFFQRSKQ
jgi:hypothetical protein